MPYITLDCDIRKIRVSVYETRIKTRGADHEPLPTGKEYK